jgi:subtilase family serine protease
MRPAHSQATRILAVACVLSAAAWGAASAASASTATAASPLAGIKAHTDLRFIGRMPNKADIPPTTAQCQATWNVDCYTADQIMQAYGLNGLYSKGITGKGATIVIIDAYGSPTIVDDMTSFDGSTGLPTVSLSVLTPVGAVPTFDSNNGDEVGWAGETTLDVEYAHVIAPGAKIDLVEAPNDNAQSLVNAVQYAVSHKLGDVITQSFGYPEQYLGKSDLEALSGVYRRAAAAHITVLASAGDTGASGINFNTGNLYTYPVANWPASDPYVTAMGGTSLNLNETGDRLSPDVVWNDTYNSSVSKLLTGSDGPYPSAGGGGKSVDFSRPSYQNSVKNIVGGSRGLPDISMSGACDGTVAVFESFPGEEGGWGLVCGTSEASPMFAGIVALADQVAGHSLGLINPALYKLSAEHAKGILLVTSGNNTVSVAQGGKTVTIHGYSARNGYSLAAGVGTINALLFVPELASAAG